MQEVNNQTLACWMVVTIRATRSRAAAATATALVAAVAAAAAVAAVAAALSKMVRTYVNNVLHFFIVIFNSAIPNNPAPSHTRTHLTVVVPIDNHVTVVVIIDRV